ncbi:MAG: LysM peptidoglycan-binding domain-containing protein [Rhodococcus sp. (in: high G+C Gram-positive bacteria)]|uniref:LysM peptidoglycan-binding domain-containing protein n=1 Tax=Rhodococcus sp. TaxID=1831 RepID=UPI003BB1307F
MSNAVLPRQALVEQQAALGRAGMGGSSRTTPRRRVVPRTDRDVRRPAPGSVTHRGSYVGVSRADHERDTVDVSWRMVLASVVITAAVLCGLLGIAQLATTDGPGASGATEVIQVESGDSLAAVAARLSPDLPAEQVIDHIMRLNAMSNSAVYPGQSLIVPSIASR